VACRDVQTADRHLAAEAACPGDLAAAAWAAQSTGSSQALPQVEAASAAEVEAQSLLGPLDGQPGRAAASGDLEQPVAAAASVRSVRRRGCATASPEKFANAKPAAARVAPAAAWADGVNRVDRSATEEVCQACGVA